MCCTCACFSDGGAAGAKGKPKSFRTRTFVAVGQETAANKGNANLLRNMEMGGMSRIWCARRPFGSLLHHTHVPQKPHVLLSCCSEARIMG